MKNREYMKLTYADNLTAWREYRQQIAQDAETLCEIVQNHRFNDGTPQQAAQEIMQAIGAENARVIIASAVNAHEGDGRLSADVIAWAEGIGWDWEMSCNLGLTLDAKMHMCHVNQTAEAIMNLPETDPEQPTEAEEQTAEVAQNEEESTMQNNVNMIRTAEAAHIAKCAEYIRNSVHTIGDYRSNWCAQRYTTPAQTRRLLAMQDAEPMPAADLAKILDKQAAGIHKNAENAVQEVETLTEYQKPVMLRIFVRWVRNRTWGYNPHVCLTVWNRTNADEIIETKASGCNYDKEAAAVSAALNQCKMILSEIVRATERGEKFSGVHTAEKLGIPCAPDFDLGGMSTLRSIMEQLGYKLTETQKRTRYGYLDYSEYIYNLREEV